MPSVGDQTRYDYGFISILFNQSATEIQYWTSQSLTDSNYTLHWHQYVNLSIRISHLVPIGLGIQAYYNFSVNIFSNIVRISNSTWHTTITLNGTVPAPAPTGISSGLVDCLTSHGLPGFFLDGETLSTISTGSNVIIGSSLWHTVTYTSFQIESTEQFCYQLLNSSTTTNQQINTTYVIDQDVGIYFMANETSTFVVDSLATYLIYYYHVLATDTSLIPPPNPLPIYIIAAVTIIILVVVVVLLIRTLWLRRRHGSPQLIQGLE
ncbi:MAG: hypothetical protein ACXADB_07020 [Candidatus Hermodarchaeia archaeon]